MTVLIRFSQTSPTSWVNGNGVTTELLSWSRSETLSASALPPWRLSVARLAGSTVFSPIPAVRRLFLPAGAGVTLAVNGIVRRVPDRTWTAFDGDDHVELVDLDRRPAHAINLMFRRTAHPATPCLVVGHTDDPLFRECVVAVALDSTTGIDRFDVLTPGPPGLVDPGTAVLMVCRVGGSSATDRPGR